MRYYSPFRPVGPGTFPRGGVKTICNFDARKYVLEARCEAWGYAEYDRVLSKREVYDYELVPVLRLRYIGKDNWGRCVYRDEFGKIRKMTEVGMDHRDLEEMRGVTLYSASGNEFEGEPDVRVRDDIVPWFVEEGEEA